MSSKYSNVPMNRFDLWAGAKASYQEFFSRMGITRYPPWEKMTQQQQKRWVQILKTGIQTALEVQSTKESTSKPIT